MPLISKCQLPFKLRPRCGKLRHTNKKKTKNTPGKRALGPFIHSYQVPFSVTGRPWFVPGFVVFISRCPLPPQTFTKLQPKHTFSGKLQFTLAQFLPL